VEVTDLSKASEASYAKIGFFIMLGVALAAGVLVYIGGVGAKNSEFIVETFFSDPVSGLDVGSSVNLRGVRVGSVKRISFIGAEYGASAAPADRQKIYVEMAFDTRLFRMGGEQRTRQMVEDLVAKGLHATVSASGVTGLSRIELNFPKGMLREERPSWRAEHPLIPPAPSILQSAADSATQILDQLNKMDFAAAYSNLLAATRSAGAALDNFNTVLSGEQGGISEIVQNVRDASISIRDFADQIRNNPSSLLRSNTPDELQETRR
jgi:paraquat-inducible protein B